MQFRQSLVQAWTNQRFLSVMSPGDIRSSYKNIFQVAESRTKLLGKDLLASLCVLSGT